ncbi:MAG: hypothetical protein K0S30_1015 [Clostridia bacterium]|jgi:hypothetical protein|nr:hypothetical protein [Clostridia bacterium]
MPCFNGCCNCNTNPYNNCSPCHQCDCKKSWLLPALLILAALFFSSGLGLLLILLGVVLLFGKELLTFIF